MVRVLRVFGVNVILWVKYAKFAHGYWCEMLVIRHLFIFMSVLLAAVSCGGGGVKPAAHDVVEKQSAHCDLAGIEESGEIIAVTMYGRDTYYEYHGKETGTAYELLSDFAKTEGLAVRVEVAADTMAMIRMLSSGEADIIIYPVPYTVSKAGKLRQSGMFCGSGKTRAGWCVRDDQPDLAEALKAWYKPGMETEKEREDGGHWGVASVKRHVRAPYISRSKGIISKYDAEFMRGSRYVGWDWRLIAAQCYQESGFDPDAVSWAGAKGLMQIIPSTAKSLGLSDIYNPRENIDAGCRYLRRLQGSFGDVRNRIDKIRFTLAAYNGGPRHIRDAMNLARKYGKSPTSYNDVSFFIRNLDKPKYYNDPVVKNGFMIGSETYNYVEQIMQRWSKYRGGKVVMPVSGDSSFSPLSPHKSRKNRFTHGKSEILNFRDSL